MKMRRLLLVAAALTTIVVLVCVALISYSQHSEFKILPKLAVAEQNYVRDLISRGKSLPASVTLQDLVDNGYISVEEVCSLNGADVTFYPTARESDPQAILVRVRLADGEEIAAMADSSIPGLPK